ncbi:MAG: RIP metalloprotease RseP [candidate division Zixibacteria bacterium]|nr:RIP metalloprotease RseP [candidate division Zixibacteria bacterium]
MLLTTILAFIFVLGLLIFVHEFGHFIIAKRAGVKVERFSLGYPPKMIGFQRGDTEYCISWIPFGGYVKMAGENPDEEDIKGEPYEFQSKSVGARAAIIAAGPVMNFITAVILLWVVFFFSGMVVPNSDSTVIDSMVPGGPAQEAGIMPGDEVVAINGQSVSTFPEMAEIIHNHVAQPVVVKWLRDGESHIATITTISEEVMDENGEKKTVGMIGVGLPTETVPLGFFSSMRQASATFGSWIMEILGFLKGLVTASISLDNVGGPLLIAQVAGQTASQGFSSLLFFTAFLSVNLGVLNILPIPVLDGGHLVFLAIEKVRGRPLSMSKRMVIQQIGMALLLLLMIVVTYNDIARFFR